MILVGPSVKHPRQSGLCPSSNLRDRPRLHSLEKQSLITYLKLGFFVFITEFGRSHASRSSILKALFALARTD